MCSTIQVHNIFCNEITVLYKYGLVKWYIYQPHHQVKMFNVNLNYLLGVLRLIILKLKNLKW